jgi:hypothetical protein
MHILASGPDQQAVYFGHVIQAEIEIFNIEQALSLPHFQEIMPYIMPGKKTLPRRNAKNVQFAQIPIGSTISSTYPKVIG